MFEIENVTICKNNAKKWRVEQKERKGVLKVLILGTVILRKGYAEEGKANRISRFGERNQINEAMPLDGVHLKIRIIT